jgi:hypothetical protein
MNRGKPQKRESKKGSRNQSPSPDRSSDRETERQKAEKMAVGAFGEMIQFYDTFAKTWAKAMSDAVSSEGFAQAVAKQVESSLDAMTLMRRQMGTWMEQYLQQMNLPTRSEIISLAERLTDLEMATDDIDAKLHEVLNLLKAQNK